MQNRFTFTQSMTILIAPDKFKGSLSAIEVCEAIQAGIHRFNPNIKTLIHPLADGGEGSLEVVTQTFLSGQQNPDIQKVTLSVADPLMRPIQAQYLIAKQTAYIEMSAASGLVLLAESERNCMHTTTFGTGEMILDAIRRGIRDIVLFIGGSATNDVGIGMASALGYRFLDTNKKPINPIGKNLTKIKIIDNKNSLLNLADVSVRVLCDVTNPLYGKQGAAHTYARQKGANDKEIEHLDRGLRNIAEVLKANDYPDLANLEGAGAAGGMGAGAVAFLGAKMVSGINFFIELTDLETKIRQANLVITGEGKLDDQTLKGKVVSGVAAMANRHHVPVVAVCGANTLQGDELGLKNIYSVMNISESIEEAMRDAKEKVTNLGFQIARDLTINNQ